jgi:hypothetical protein
MAITMRGGTVPGVIMHPDRAANRRADSPTFVSGAPGRDLLAQAARGHQSELAGLLSGRRAGWICA